MNKIKCFLGLHNFEFLLWSCYRYKDFSNIGYNINERQEVKVCKYCDKLSTLPKWYSDEFRKKYPYVDIHGCSSEWKAEIK